MNILLLFGVFFVLIMLSVPIGVALGVATSLTICLTSNIGPVMVAQKAFTGLDSFTLIAIPFFMLAGNLMALAGTPDVSSTLPTPRWVSLPVAWAWLPSSAVCFLRPSLAPALPL